MANLFEGRKLVSNYLAQPAAELLAKTSIRPSTITWLGFFITLVAAVLIVTGQLLVAGLVVLIAGFFDILDGALARRTKQATPFGAILDSTLDRLSEGLLLFSIVILNLLKGQLTAEVWLVYLALIGSLLVSYVKARAEALGLACQVGLCTRAERVVVLALGLLLSQIDYALTIALAVIVLFSFVTAGQRIFYVWQQTKTG